MEIFIGQIKSVVHAQEFVWEQTFADRLPYRPKLIHARAGVNYTLRSAGKTRLSLHV